MGIEESDEGVNICRNDTMPAGTQEIGERVAGTVLAHAISAEALLAIEVPDRARARGGPECRIRV